MTYEDFLTFWSSECNLKLSIFGNAYPCVTNKNNNGCNQISEMENTLYERYGIIFDEKTEEDKNTFSPCVLKYA